MALISGTERQIVTREDAEALGRKRYFTGVPCIHGHVDARRTDSNCCETCGREKAKARMAKYRADPERRERLNAQRRAWAERNPEKAQAHAQSSYRKHRASRQATARAHYRANQARYKASAMARKHMQANRTPTWADLDAIRFFYECKPKGCHVDHVVPLQGKTVSGLHVETNLQWLPARVNLQKSNRVEL